MKTEAFGTIVEFGALEPGDFFISILRDTPMLGIAAKFARDKDNICVVLKAPSGVEFELDSLQSSLGVWKISEAIIRPKLKPGSLNLVSQITVGALMLGPDANYLVCKQSGTVRQMHLHTGLISAVQGQPMMTRCWEIGISDSDVNEWHVIFDSEL